jgi:hypothetical protein
MLTARSAARAVLFAILAAAAALLLMPAAAGATEPGEKPDPGAKRTTCADVGLDCRVVTHDGTVGVLIVPATDRAGDQPGDRGASSPDDRGTTTDNGGKEERPASSADDAGRGPHHGGASVEEATRAGSPEPTTRAGCPTPTEAPTDGPDAPGGTDGTTTEAGQAAAAATGGVTVYVRHEGGGVYTVDVRHDDQAADPVAPGERGTPAAVPTTAVKVAGAGP